MSKTNSLFESSPANKESDDIDYKQFLKKHISESTIKRMESLKISKLSLLDLSPSIRGN